MTTDTITLRDRMKAAEDKVRDLRDRKADLKAKNEGDKARVEKMPATALKTGNHEFDAMIKTGGDYRDCVDELANAVQEHHDLLKAFGESPEDYADGGSVRALTKTPGRWLGAVLESRKSDVSALATDVRFKAAPMALTTTNYTRSIESAAFIDLLTPYSVAVRAGVPVVRTDGTEARLPRFTELPIAKFIPESGAFPQSGPGLDMVTVKPPKVGLITPLSIELFDDLTPELLAGVQLQILRAVGLGFDRGIMFGTGLGAQPLGVANAVGVSTVTAPLTGLSPFAQAIATLVGANAFPGALVINPVDLGRMLNITEFDGASKSNVPLWTDAITRAADGAFSMSLPYFGVPVWPTPAAPEGTALVFDPAQVTAVLRKDADIALDPFWDLANGQVALRSYLRGDVVVNQAAGTVRITFGTTVTALAASDVFTSAGHGFTDGEAVKFAGLTGGAPLDEVTTYYITASTPSTFKVSLTPGGTALDITSNMTAGTVRSVA